MNHALRQRLQQCVVVSAWDEATVFARLALMLDRELPEITAFVVACGATPRFGVSGPGIAPKLYSPGVT